MLDKFWEGIGTNLAQRWLEYIFGPAFLFWAGGFGLYAWKTGWQGLLINAQMSTQFQQIIWIVMALLILVFSSVMMQAIRFPILRLLEGYWPWPVNYLGKAIIAWRKAAVQRKTDELRHLKTVEASGNLETKQRERLIQLDAWVHWYPAKSSDLLPTALGNILRSRERSPERKYGLEAVVCWPRLWPLLPEIIRTDLANTRSALDRLVEFWFWGLLFLIWSFLTPWAILIGFLWMMVTYGVALQAAMTYGDLLETAFDLHRLSLYDAMGWSRPTDSEQEKALGKQLTEFLWRGTMAEKMPYQGR